MKRKLVFLLYSIALAAGFPFIVLYAAVRIARDRRYLHTIGERLGGIGSLYRQTAPGSIWIHAVSVGEVLSCVPFLCELKARHPERNLFVSVTTLAGRKAAAERLKGIADGVFYAPVDYAFCVRRVLRALRPALVVILETEIWPNLWRETKRSGARLMTVNARISDQAWPKYARMRWFFSTVLAEADAVLAQSEISRERFAALGASGAVTAGNLKYDYRPAPPPADLAAFLAGARVWIAASTMPPAHPGDCDETPAVLDAFARLLPKHAGLVLLLAPRKPEMFDPAAAELKARGLAFVRRSELRPDTALAPVLLLDTIGELASLFPLSEAVFMGGTLAHRGGHNILEPALAGVPVICGPHMENFPEISGEFRSAGAVVEIGAAEQIAEAVGSLLDDGKLRAELGERGRALARSRQGATVRAAEAACSLADSAMPVRARGAIPHAALALLSRVWLAGVRRRRRSDLDRERRLPVPVVSVGGLAMGGSGKTPFAIWLAGKLAGRGLQTGILTRGYRRRDADRVTVVAKGEAAPVSQTGDEGQLLVRVAIGPVGIATDRYAAGMAVLAQETPDVFVLDDGFQHWRLARDFDLVLIDSLDPFAGGVFPVGRLREPAEALRRAGAVVITRTRAGWSYERLIAEIRKHTAAEIFLSRVRPGEWIEMGGGGVWPCDAPPVESVVAFCGLGNPASFWNSVGETGLRCAARRAFADHHVYSPREIQALALEARTFGAEALATTEKDLMNLPPEAADAAWPTRIYALRAALEVEREEALVDAVCRSVSARVKTT